MKTFETTKYKRELKKVLKTSNITIIKIQNTIDLFLNSPSNNSLDTKMIEACSDYKNLHQIRVTGDYRILFELLEDVLILRHIGNHNYIEKKTADC